MPSNPRNWLPVNLNPTSARSTLAKIVSGGQTGADRAALDFAIERGVPHGGWCPKGRKAEDGRIPIEYQLQESSRADYLQRTEMNVRDSDGTVLFTMKPKLSGGSRRTAQFVASHNKPLAFLPATLGSKRCAKLLAEFIQQYDIRTMNVAGSRASKEPDVAAFVTAVLTHLYE